MYWKSFADVFSGSRGWGEDPDWEPDYLASTWSSRALASNVHSYTFRSGPRPGHVFECLRTLRAELLLEPLPSQDAKPGSLRDVHLNLSPQPAKEVWRVARHSIQSLLNTRSQIRLEGKVLRGRPFNLKPPTPDLPPTSLLLSALFLCPQDWPLSDLSWPTYSRLQPYGESFWKGDFPSGAPSQA